MDKTRRHFLQATVAGSVACLGTSRGDEPDNIISRENRHPGTKDWMLTKTRIDSATKYRSPWIEGYCSKTSVKAGEKIEFFVSTDPVSEFSIDVYRLGYYGGQGGRHMRTLGPFAGSVQAVPPIGEKRLRQCEWRACTELEIPGDWVSGVYLGKLTAVKEGLQSYVIFIVKDDRKADYLFQCSDTTWQAYNRWPSQFSLYDDGKHEWYWGGNVLVSFRRPYGKYCQILDAPLSLGSGEFLLWEFPLAYWLEEHGYDISYISNLDTHANGQGLSRAKGLLSVGHDEYWTKEMFQSVKAAMNRGLNLAFFSANTCCGKILFAPDGLSFERVGVWGPHDPAMKFESMDKLAHEPPYANTLIGAHSTGPVTGGADWTCQLPEHWLFSGTGMKKGEGIAGLVGWEWHGDPAPIPGLEVVASGPTQREVGKPNGGLYTATVYPGPKGNFVFNAATIWWSDGLSAPPGYLRPKVYTEPKGPDPRVQRITANILKRMVEPR